MNSEQHAAVSRVLAAEDYTLVLGMPGSGKTTTIVSMVQALVAQGKRVLLTSYTNRQAGSRQWWWWWWRGVDRVPRLMPASPVPLLVVVRGRRSTSPWHSPAA